MPPLTAVRAGTRGNDREKEPVVLCDLWARAGVRA